MMALVTAFTWKNMFYLQKESQVRELLLTPQDYAEAFPLNSLEVYHRNFIQYISQSDASYSGTSVCFDDTGNVIVTLWENHTLIPRNRMWIHGRLRRNFEHQKGHQEKTKPKEVSVHPNTDKAHFLMLKLAASVIGTTMFGLALYYSSSPMKNLMCMTVFVGWMGGNVYWLELVEGGFSNLLNALICGMIRFQPYY
jgi:hypothetical protein